LSRKGENTAIIRRCRDAILQQKNHLVWWLNTCPGPHVVRLL
jgi:hypothetical protein